MLRPTDFTVNGCIYTHVSGRYQLRTRASRDTSRNIEYRLVNGPNIWLSAKTRDLLKAGEYVENLLINRGVRVESRITLRQFASRFFARTDPASYRRYLEGFGYIYDDNYYEMREAILNNHILPRFGDMPIREITTYEIEMWSTTLTKKSGAGLLASNTRSKICSVMSIIMDFALKKNVIDSNPCDKAHPIKAVSKKRECLVQSEIEMLFPKDYERLLYIFGYQEGGRCVIKNEREWALMWALYFSIMADTGFRPGEVSAISMDSFVSDCGLYVESSVDSNIRQIKNSIKTTNSGQRYKVGIISSYTQDLLRLYLASRTDSNAQLFIINGGVVTTATSNKHFKESLKRAGIPLNGRTQYSLRHTFDTYMLNNVSKDLTEADVQRLMGHTSYRREYDHRTAEDLVRRLSGAKGIIDAMRG